MKLLRWQTSINDAGREVEKLKMAIINSKELSIDTVTPTINIGEIMVSADRRGKELTTAERIRRVVIPANHWGELQGRSNDTPMQGLTDVLRNGLRDIANARLRDFLQENPLARTVALADYTIPALLAWSEETASSRGSITFDRDDVIEWYATSKIKAAMAAKDAAAGKGQQFQDFMQNRLAALAAKNHGLKQVEDATKLQVLLADDAESTIGAELIQRLAHIEKLLNARKLDTSISLDML